MAQRSKIAQWQAPIQCRASKCPSDSGWRGCEYTGDFSQFMSLTEWKQELVFISASSVAADALDNRSIPFVFLAAVQLFSYIVLLVDSNNRHLRMAAYYLGGAYGGLSPLLGGWINCSCGGNKQLRSFVTAMMVSVG